MKQRAQLIVECGAAVGREGREVRAGGWVSRKELALDFEEEREGNAAALFGGRDDNVTEWGVGVGFLARAVVRGARACGGVRDVVHEETLMCIGQLLGLVVADLGEDDGGQRGGGRGGGAWGGMLGKDGRTMGDAGAVELVSRKISEGKKGCGEIGKRRCCSVVAVLLG